MELRTSTNNARFHVEHAECHTYEEFAESTGGWELDWRQLDRGPLNAAVLQVATPSMLVSRFRCNRRFHQRGMSPPGMRSFGIVGAHSSLVDWNGREGSKNQIEIFPTFDPYEAVSHPEFLGDGVSIPEERIRSTAETLGLPDPLGRCHEGSCFVEPGPRGMDTLRRSLVRLYSAVSTHGDSPLSEAACSEMEF